VIKLPNDVEALKNKLTPFRYRLRLLLMWRLGAIWGLFGVLIAIALDLLDWFNVIFVPLWVLIVSIGIGLGIGVLISLFKKIPDEAVAAMIDHRGDLKDRIRTALERTEAHGVFDTPLMNDALLQIETAKSGRLFGIRFGRLQGLFCFFLPLFLLLHFLPSMWFLQSEQIRNEKAEVKAMANQVEEVARPILDRAKKPDAKALEKQIANNVELFKRRAQEGRLGKKEALLKLNQILAQSQKLEQEHQKELDTAVMKTMTVAEQFKKAEIEQRKLDAQIKQLSEQMSKIERQLRTCTNENGTPLNQQQKSALSNKMASLQQQMRSLQLSKQAQEYLSKLMNDPNYQEAMKRLQELTKQLCSNPGSGQKLSQAELDKQMVALQKNLEEMAKRYSDKEIQQMAKDLLEQVKRMNELKLSKNACEKAGGMCSSLLSVPCTGKGVGPGDSMSLWSGQPDSMNQGKKHAELKIPMKNAVITGQNPLTPGPADYTDFKATPTTNSANIPLSRVLTSYQQKAESAINKQDIPPAERKRVKNYFDSLQSGK
jgi:hypothetical protein